MAHKYYYVENNEEEKSIFNNFSLKMGDIQYHSIGVRKLDNSAQLILYDMNGVSVLFETGKINVYLGNITMIGKLEDIIKTKKRIEKTTGMEFKTVKE